MIKFLLYTCIRVPYEEFVFNLRVSVFYYCDNKFSASFAIIKNILAKLYKITKGVKILTGFFFVICDFLNVFYSKQQKQCFLAFLTKKVNLYLSLITLFLPRYEFFLFTRFFGMVTRSAGTN